MSKADEVLNFFNQVHILEQSDHTLIFRMEDSVLEIDLKGIEVIGYDEYLDDIRSLAKQYVEAIEKLTSRLNEILEDENAKIRAKVIQRIQQAAPHTGKSLLVRRNNQ